VSAPRLALLVAALFACRSPADSGDSEASAPLVCTATLSPTVQTVVNLAWEAPPGSQSWAELGVDATYGTQTWTVSDTAVSLPLVGVPGGTTMRWRGVSEVDGVRSTCVGETLTGEVPADIPAFVVDVDDRDLQSSTGLFVGAYYDIFAPQPYFVAFDRAGAVVWYATGDDGTLSPDLQLARDGDGVLYNRFDWSAGLAGSRIERIGLDGTPLESIATPDAHHMFAQLPGGILAYQQADAREYTEPSTGVTDTWFGDAIAEVAPGGEVTTVFSTWDWLTPAPGAHTDELSIYGGVDWTHGNALKYDEADDAWLLSLAHTQDVVGIDRPTGTPTDTWGLDGVPAAPPFDLQHDPTLLDDTHLLMFSTDPDTSLSGAIEYAIGPDALTEVWRRGFDAHTDFLGQATRLENGNTFVNYGDQGVMEEVTAEGVVAWHGSTLGASPTGQFRLVESLYASPGSP